MSMWSLILIKVQRQGRNNFGKSKQEAKFRQFPERGVSDIQENKYLEMLTLTLSSQSLPLHYISQTSYCC